MPGSIFWNGLTLIELGPAGLGELVRGVRWHQESMDGRGCVSEQTKAGCQEKGVP